MKRVREPPGTNDTTTKAEDPMATNNRKHSNSNSNSSSNASSALKQVRAKLEQARLKKLAAEERLFRQKRKQQGPFSTQTHPATDPSPTAPFPAATTTTTTNPSPTTFTQQQQQQQARAQEAQEALDRARSRFLALKQQQQQQQQQHSIGSTTATPWNRNKRQHYLSPQQQQRHSSSALPPISALAPSFSLTIANVAEGCPPGSIVYHQQDCTEAPWSSMGRLGSRAALVEALGGTEAVEAMHRAREDLDDEEIVKQPERSKKNPETTQKRGKATSSSLLLQRKIQLQNELLALKEKLEKKSSHQEQKRKRKQQKPRNGTAAATAAASATVNHDESKKRKIPPTKEGLERRKAEAQTVMDISYWKHFVSKQEHLLEQVTSKINNMVGKSNPNGGTYQECLQERHSTNKAISKVQQDLDILEQRQAVVEEGIVDSTEKLLGVRQALYQAKKLEQQQQEENED